VSSIIRSKFRHLTLSDHGDAKRARLVPVMPRTKWDPEGSEENRLFWEATPSGEGEVPVEWLPEEAREPGRSCVYVDLRPPVLPSLNRAGLEALPVEFAAGEVPWTLDAVNLDTVYGHVTITFHPVSKRSGELRFGITAASASLLLLPHLEAITRARLEWTIANLDNHGAVWAPPLWRVDFLPAE